MSNNIYSNRFDPIIGKIFCTYNEDKKDFEKIRVRKAKNGKVTVCKLDENNHMDKSNTSTYTMENFRTMLTKTNSILLKSEGIVSISNVVSSTIGSTVIPDVILIFFPNNPATKVPQSNQPYIVARQGIENYYAAMANESVVGMSVSIDTLPAGFALSDFMANEKVSSSKMTHFYKTDTPQELSILLDNDDTKKILKDLHTHACNNLGMPPKKSELYNTCIGGYCKTLKRFITECDFINDIYTKIGIIKIDVPLESNVPLNDDDKVLVSTLCGGVHIDKAVPIKFDYDINMELIKMRYFLICDSNDILWIVPYTISEDEFDANSVYKLTEESTLKLQERLKKVVKAYDASTNIKSDSPVKMVNIENKNNNIDEMIF